MAKRILVVEDEANIRRVYKKFLESLGYEVETAETATPALHYFRKKEFDLILTDMIMPPGMNGIEFAAWVVRYCQHYHKKLPSIILATGENEIREPQPNITKVLYKPIRLEDLRQLDNLI